MNRDILQGNWKQLKGNIKEQWGKLTDDDLTMAEGNYDQLVGRIQERYGYSRDEAQRRLDEWLDSRGGETGFGRA
ncbi:MAG TPA: CsbD family protein [Trueperaceae bacterium]|nr:CsbD family protein [Trueperaceae bacterium]